jgi:putative oxidoreductase
VPRIVCGYWLTSNFGAAKFGLPWSPPENNLHFGEVAFWFPHDVAEYGGVFAAFPAFFAWMGAFAEGIGGLAWMLGMFTRPFSFLLMCTMAVAAFVQHAHEELWQQLPAIGFMWVALFGLVLGSGCVGVDHWINKSLSRKCGISA